VRTHRRWLALAAVLPLLLGACGFDVEEPDLFLLTRTGQHGTLSLLVNYGGTVSCNGGKAKNLPDPLLLNARNLESSLDADAMAKLNIPTPKDSVFSYKVRLQDGTIYFPDTAGATHSELAQAEQFALQTDQQVCQ
jgi:hypothetical protein